MDEQVVTPEGGLCTIKDCCVVICDEGAPQENPGRGKYTNRDAITRAFDAVGAAVERAHGLEVATRVTGTLYDLPILYNARLTRAIGRAKFASFLGMPMPTMIELTGAIDIPHDYMHRLLVHEGCHVARAVIAKAQFNYEAPHGIEWQSLMVACGEKPEAHCIDPRILAQGSELRAKKLGIERPAAQLGPSDVRLGDTVWFQTKKHGRVTGRVEQKTDRAVVIRDANGDRWRATYGVLNKEPTP